MEVHKEGNYFVAVDLLTNGAGQGSSEEEAVQNLKKGLEDHDQLSIELTPGTHNLTCPDITLEQYYESD
jgi:predicted RNase H-like HicB family nuclease